MCNRSCYGEDNCKRGRGNEESKGGWIWLRCLLVICEDGVLKPVEVILRRGVGKEGE
jgi:hypothetical protein